MPTAKPDTPNITDGMQVKNMPAKQKFDLVFKDTCQAKSEVTTNPNKQLRMRQRIAVLIEKNGENLKKKLPTVL
jgi:hypothetical protein